MTTASTAWLRTMISRNELVIMRLRDNPKPYSETAIKILQRDIERWQQEVETLNTTERMREQGKHE